MAKQPILFLVPFEWTPEYGTEVRALKARTQEKARQEITKFLESEGKIPDGYTVITGTQMRQIMLAMEHNLGLRGSVHWVTEDVMEAKHCSRERAEAWLDRNQKYLSEAGTKAGWEVIRML